MHGEQLCTGNNSDGRQGKARARESKGKARQADLVAAARLLLAEQAASAGSQRRQPAQAASAGSQAVHGARPWFRWGATCARARGADAARDPGPY